ncbi:hypothetical protein LJY18_08280 [Pseudomonas sp. MMS21-TM103]|uniref:hypothetical protein n=1 Tax=Pseudomonas sp. MMS21 TM103 TaxID=2886506 RepID=UPI001EE0B0D8|nr:hypothetical protein [Pseudomonas sp. MMS21 TM103]MCG4453304.1 hypothetical protein [Pseudomonas sp. MMS21 TM103]
MQKVIEQWLFLPLASGAFSIEEVEMSSITLEIPNADAEALLRFAQQVNAREQCSSDPWEASRLESALQALIEALKEELK